MKLLPQFLTLIQQWRPCFADYRTHRRAVGFALSLLVCLGRRTISRVWETTGPTEQRSYAAAYRLFNQAVWNWDEVCRLLVLHVLALAPGVRLWVVLDDTLAHKRGKSVWGMGWWRDAVASTKKRVATASGHNWVVLAVAFLTGRRRGARRE